MREGNCTHIKTNLGSAFGGLRGSALFSNSGLLFNNFVACILELCTMLLLIVERGVLAAVALVLETLSKVDDGRVATSDNAASVSSSLVV